MKLIVGLGNPGKKYERTRHNIGFWVIDELSCRWNIPVHREKWNALIGEGLVKDKKVLLVKPSTYMNLSGEAVRPIMDYFRISLEDVLIIYDDLDLPLGKIRLRQKGRSGGHNGIKSIIAHLGTEKFKRIKIGIDRPPITLAVPDYVLSPFTKEELPEAMNAVQRAADAVQDWLETDFLKAMNRYN